MSTGSKIFNTLYEPAVAGIIGWAIGPMILGESRNDVVPGLFGWSVPMAAGVGSFGGELVGKVISNWVLPMIPANSTFATSQGLILTPICAGAATTAFLYPALNGTASGYLKAFATGGISSIGAHYANDTIIQPYLGP